MLKDGAKTKKKYGVGKRSERKYLKITVNAKVRYMKWPLEMSTKGYGT